MKKQTKEDLKHYAMLGTGTLTEFALLQSMAKSKGLTIMVIVGLVAFAGFAAFLFKMAGQA